MSNESVYTQDRVGDYIKVFTGRHFYPLDPKPEDITILDVAHSLSNLCRYTGHTERFYSVGEHSIFCATIAKSLRYSTLQQLYCLLHDASESVVNDLASPVKQNIPQYKAIENNIMSVMWEVAGIPKPTEEDYKLVKMIDNTLLVNEMNQLMGRYDMSYLEYYRGVNMDLKSGFNAGESKPTFLKLYNNLIAIYKSECAIQDGSVKI